MSLPLQNKLSEVKDYIVFLVVDLMRLKHTVLNMYLSKEKVRMINISSSYFSKNILFKLN